MCLQMPLQGAHSKSTMQDQPLKQSQVTQEHLPKLSWGSGQMSPPPTEISRLAQERERSWRPRYRWSYQGSLLSARERDLTCPHLSRSRGSDKAREGPGRFVWPPPPKKQGPASRPGTAADESHGSGPTQTQRRTLR